jgi:hypothetical protein
MSYTHLTAFRDKQEGSPSPLCKRPLAHKFPFESTTETKNGDPQDCGSLIADRNRKGFGHTRSTVQLAAPCVLEVMFAGGWREGAIFIPIRIRFIMGKSMTNREYVRRRSIFRSNGEISTLRKRHKHGSSTRITRSILEESSHTEPRVH